MLGPLLEVELSKKCTPLWREAHFEIKMHKTTPVADHFWKLRCRKSARGCGPKHTSKSKCTKHTKVRTTFGRWDVEKVHAVVVRSTFSKSKCTKRTSSGPLLEVEMSKKCTLLWREAHFQVKMYKTHQWRTTFGSWDVEKVHAVVARSTFRSQNVQNTTCSRHFWRFRCRFAWQGQGIAHLVKREQNVRVLSHFQKRWQAWDIWTGSAKDAFSVAGAVQETCSSELLGGPGADFLRGVAFCSLRSSGLLRWLCVTCAALCMTWPHFFRGRRSTLDRWNGKIAKRIGARLSALHATFRCQLWKMKKSLRIAAFFFNVVKLSNSKNWGSLA